MKDITNMLVKVKRNKPKAFYYFDENGIYQKATKEEIITKSIRGVRPIGSCNYRYDAYPKYLAPEHSIQREFRAIKALEKLNPGDTFYDFIRLFNEEPICLPFYGFANCVVKSDKDFLYYFDVNGIFSKCKVGDKIAKELNKYKGMKKLALSHFEIPKTIPEDILSNHLQVGQNILDFVFLAFKEYYESFCSHVEPFVIDWNGKFFVYQKTDNLKTTNDNPRQEALAQMRNDITSIMKNAISEDYVGEILEHTCKDTESSLMEDIIQNVLDTSAWEEDGHYNEDDIRLAIGRELIRGLNH